MILSHQQLRLIALRRACGLSQVALAPHLGVTQASISHWERTGRIRSENLANLERLAALTEKRRAKTLPSLRVAAAELAEMIVQTDPHAALRVDDRLVDAANVVLELLKQETHAAS